MSFIHPFIHAARLSEN